MIIHTGIFMVFRWNTENLIIRDCALGARGHWRSIKHGSRVIITLTIVDLFVNIKVVPFLCETRVLYAGDIAVPPFKFSLVPTHTIVRVVRIVTITEKLHGTWGFED